MANDQFALPIGVVAGLRAPAAPVAIPAALPVVMVAT